MKWQKSRKAFSLITAIFVIVLMSSVAMYIMNISGKMVKETTTQYHREQSMLLARSFTEYAVMSVTANEHNSTNCLNTISGTSGLYSINANISYIGNGELDSSCARRLSTTVATPKSPLNVIIDVFVSYKDQDYPDPDNAPHITYHKRSLIKI